MTSIERRHFLALSAAAAATVGTAALPISTARAENTSGPRQYFPRGGRFRRLNVIVGDELDHAEAVLVGTLQGLVSRGASQNPVVPLGSPHVYITTADESLATQWLDDLERNYGIKTTMIDSVWELLDGYVEQPGQAGISSYVLYGDDPSVSVATTLAGLTGSVAVHASLEGEATAAGLQKAVDVTGKDDAWVAAAYGDRIRRDFAVEQKPSFGYQLRDLATMAGAQLFYDGNSDYRTDLVKALKPDSPVIGWGDASEGEDGFVSTSSKAGTFMIAADWAANLSTLSGVESGSLRQKGDRSAPAVEEDVHYVTFVVTDGDNVQWFLTSLGQDTNWWTHPDRGSTSVGWGMAPTMIDLAPSVMRWYYDEATARDEFVVGPSGSGYFYPSQYPADRLRLATKTLASYMERVDLGVVQILDFDALERRDVWDEYTHHDAIDGLFYLEYSRYDGGDGKITWSHDKPVIAARHMLWDGLEGADEASVAAAINAAPRNPRTGASYSMVSVHAWSKDLGSIRQVINNLASHVRVVSPGAFTKLITENVRH